MEGAALTLTMLDGNTQTKELVPGPHGTRVKGWQRGIPFPDGHRLEASYDVKGGVAIAGATGDKSQTWTFHADGTCAVSEEKSVSVPGAKASSEGMSWKGTYTLKHHTLSMSFEGSGQRDYTIFLSGEELSAAPKVLFVDMSVFKQAE